jgi:hypothetical protein
VKLIFESCQIMTLVRQLSFPSQGHGCIVGWRRPSYKKQFYASIVVEDSDEFCKKMTNEDADTMNEEENRRKQRRGRH